MNFGNEMCLSTGDSRAQIWLYTRVNYVLCRRLFGLFELFVIRARLEGGEF